MVGLRCSSQRSVYGQCPVPLWDHTVAKPPDAASIETWSHHCTRSVPCSLHTCAHRDCATHLAEWCPPCYYAGGPLTSIVEPRGACVTVRDLWTLRPGTRHSVRHAPAFTRPSRCRDFVTKRRCNPKNKLLLLLPEPIPSLLRLLLI